jgi:hypothetical protein
VPLEHQDVDPSCLGNHRRELLSPTSPSSDSTSERGVTRLTEGATPNASHNRSARPSPFVTPRSFDAGCDYAYVGEWCTAQAVELVRALSDQLRQMTARLSIVERQCVATGHLASAMRSEAAQLRRPLFRGQPASAVG